MKKNLQLPALLNLIEQPNREKCIKIFQDHRVRIINAPGSAAKHQAWEGGYVDHLEQGMNFGIELYELTNAQNPLPFSIPDVILVFFLHDLEKPFKYVAPRTRFKFPHSVKLFREKMIAKYGIVLNADHLNALEYVHGEGHDHNATQRIQGPLAAFCHICDVMSARIWYDEPKR